MGSDHELKTIDNKDLFNNAKKIFNQKISQPARERAGC
jgi:hypothetical protein